MAIEASHTDRRGFSTEMSGAEARRLLRLSVGVVVMIGVGIVSAALSVGAHPVAVKRDARSILPTVVMHAETGATGARAI